MINTIKYGRIHSWPCFKKTNLGVVFKTVQNLAIFIVHVWCHPLFFSTDTSTKLRILFFFGLLLEFCEAVNTEPCNCWWRREEDGQGKEGGQEAEGQQETFYDLCNFYEKCSLYLQHSVTIIITWWAWGMGHTHHLAKNNSAACLGVIMVFIS